MRWYARSAALILARAGRTAEAEPHIARALEGDRGGSHFHHTMYNVASAYAVMGRKAEAMRWLERTTFQRAHDEPALGAHTWTTRVTPRSG